MLISGQPVAGVRKLTTQWAALRPPGIPFHLLSCFIPFVSRTLLLLSPTWLSRLSVAKFIDSSQTSRGHLNHSSRLRWSIMRHGHPMIWRLHMQVSILVHAGRPICPEPTNCCGHRSPFLHGTSPFRVLIGCCSRVLPNRSILHFEDGIVICPTDLLPALFDRIIIVQVGLLPASFAKIGSVQCGLKSFRLSIPSYDPCGQSYALLTVPSFGQFDQFLAPLNLSSFSQFGEHQIDGRHWHLSTLDILLVTFSDAGFHVSPFRA